MRKRQLLRKCGVRMSYAAGISSPIRSRSACCRQAVLLSCRTIRTEKPDERLHSDSYCPKMEVKLNIDSIDFARVAPFSAFQNQPYGDQVYRRMSFVLCPGLHFFCPSNYIPVMMCRLNPPMIFPPKLPKLALLECPVSSSREHPQLGRASEVAFRFSSSSMMRVYKKHVCTERG